MTGIRSTSLAVTAVFASTLLGCSYIDARLGLRDQDFARTRAAIKGDLMRSDNINAAPIDVVRDGSDLVLEGYVASEQERDEVLRLARRKAAGSTVVDRLEVR